MRQAGDQRSLSDIQPDQRQRRVVVSGNGDDLCRQGVLDTGIFFLSALMNFGSNFMTCLPYHDIPLLYGNYKFITDNENGFENQSWKILRLSNYRLYEVPVPVRR